MSSRIITALVLVTAGIALGQTQAARKLREDLQQLPFNESIVIEDLRYPTSELVDVLWSEFRATPDASLEQRKKKQVIAAALCRMKADDGEASNYLVKLVEEAIRSEAPVVLAQDEHNREIKGKMNPAFEQWAAEHNLTARDAAARELFAYPGYVLELSYLVDPKFIYLFREGLKSRNQGVAVACISALARLNDLSSLPLISAAAKNWPNPAHASEAIAGALTKFEGQRATTEIRRIFASTAILSVYERYIANRLDRKGK
jgi:hypothetical protein